MHSFFFIKLFIFIQSYLNPFDEYLCSLSVFDVNIHNNLESFMINQCNDHQENKLQ